MAISPVPKNTRADGWAVQIPWWRDSQGKPNSLCGSRPSWHGVIFFVGAATPTRAALNLLTPAHAFWYVAAYLGCVAVGQVAGHAVRKRQSDRFSRKCSGWLGITGITGTCAAALFATGPAPAATPPLANYAPMTTAAFLVLITLGGSLLSRLWPACSPQESVQAEIDELTHRLAEARARQTALGQAAGARPYDAKAVRAWARAQGLTVPARGRVPAHLVEAWRSAGGNSAS